MNRNQKHKWINLIWQAAKIGAGSSAAIFIATQMNLQFSASAGTIALLTLMTTKWETLKLSVYRVVTYFGCALLAGFIFTHMFKSWAGYGIYVFLIILISEWMGWKTTVSVNAVIGAHFMQTHNFSPEFIWNEFMLVFIGITIAIILNLFHLNESNKKEIIRNMRYTEERLQSILKEIAFFLYEEDSSEHRKVWEEIEDLENKLQIFVGEACEYQGNTFVSHPQYYIDYFEMRYQQLGILHSLQHEINRIRTKPQQAKIVADYFVYLSDFVVEVNAPDEQMIRLMKLFEEFRSQPLPENRGEFESRAILYHILMDIEDFILLKKRFVDEMDEHKLKIYWKQDKRIMQE